MGDRSYNQRALLIASHRKHRAVGGGTDKARLDAAQDRPGVDDDNVEMFLAFAQQSTKRNRRQCAGMMRVGGSHGQNSDIRNVGGADVFQKRPIGDRFEHAIGGVHIQAMG